MLLIKTMVYSIKTLNIDITTHICITFPVFYFQFNIIQRSCKFFFSFFLFYLFFSFCKSFFIIFVIFQEDKPKEMESCVLIVSSRYVTVSLFSLDVSQKFLKLRVFSSNIEMISIVGSDNFLRCYTFLSLVLANLFDEMFSHFASKSSKAL